MTWLHLVVSLSVALNAFLAVVVIILAGFRREEEIRHRGLDREISEIKSSIGRVRDNTTKLFERLVNYQSSSNIHKLVDYRKNLSEKRILTLIMKSHYVMRKC